MIARTDITNRWFNNPEAQALIASCASNPPKQVYRSATYVITRDEWWELDQTDPRIIRLGEIRAAFADTLPRDDEVTDDLTAFEQLCCDTIEEAILAAKEAAARLRVAA